MHSVVRHNIDMKKILGIVVLGLLLSGNAYAVSDANLSTWYQTCKQAGHPHNYCKCNIEVMDNKLSNYEFEKLVSQSWKVADWMFDNVVPVCGYPND